MGMIGDRIFAARRLFSINGGNLNKAPYYGEESRQSP